MFRSLLPHLVKLRDDAAGAAGAALDRALVSTALELTRRAPERESVARHDHDESLRVLARVAEAYGEERFRTAPESFFAAPDPVAPRVEPVRALARSADAVVDLS